jgi:response regulator RpfG family c-di-GMP phosphodiesterase
MDATKNGPEPLHLRRTCRCASSGKFIRSFKPDLMLLDERLLTRDGTDLLQRLHLMKDLQDIPLLLLGTDSPGSKWEQITPY